MRIASIPFQDITYSKGKSARNVEHVRLKFAKIGIGSNFHFRFFIFSHAFNPGECVGGGSGSGSGSGSCSGSGSGSQPSN
jgi:hypothetical protein